MVVAIPWAVDENERLGFQMEETRINGMAVDDMFPFIGESYRSKVTALVEQYGRAL